MAVEKKVRSIIGQTRTVRTAVLAVEYLRLSCCWPHSNIYPDLVRYEFHEATNVNGFWLATIYVDVELSIEDGNKFVDTCRAFVAGAGEVWA